MQPFLNATINSNEKTVFFYLINRDKKYPLLNVAIKMNEIRVFNIGTVYPGVVNTFYEDTLRLENEIIYNFVIWYSNSESIEATIDILKNATNDFELKETIYSKQ